MGALGAEITQDDAVADTLHAVRNPLGSIATIEYAEDETTWAGAMIPRADGNPSRMLVKGARRDTFYRTVASCFSASLRVANMGLCVPFA